MITPVVYKDYDGKEIRLNLLETSYIPMTKLLIPEKYEILYEMEDGRIYKEKSDDINSDFIMNENLNRIIILNVGEHGLFHYTENITGEDHEDDIMRLKRAVAKCLHVDINRGENEHCGNIIYEMESTLGGGDDVFLFNDEYPSADWLYSKYY